jgi:hypothetical protein
VHREPVASEVLCGVGYDPDRNTLELEFTSGEVYRYFDVPPELHVGLMTAVSHGAFFAAHIRDAGFEFERVG